MSRNVAREASYQDRARQVRADTLLMTYGAGSGHPGSSFSSVELLVWLYGEELAVDPDRPDDPQRDRLVFSKGHASPALYAVLAREDFFPYEELFGLRRLDGSLEGHAVPDTTGVEFASGSLGQGLSFAVGTQLGARVAGEAFRTVVVVGDGELQEGAVWEAAMSAGHRDLDGLVAVVEANGVQNDDRVAETKSLASIEEKFAAFGWATVTCDGHDFADIDRAFTEAWAADGPTAVIADTTKGHGVSFMANDRLGYHSTVLSREELTRALAELGAEDRLSEIDRWTD